MISSSLPTCVLFDWDNTLVESSYACYKSFVHTQKHFGMMPYSLEDYRKRPPLSIRDDFKTVFSSRHREAEEVYEEYFATHHLDHVTPMEHAETLLYFLWSQRIPVGVCSNKIGHALRKEVEFFGWSRYVRYAVGSLDCAYDKPHSDMPLYVLGHLHQRPSMRVWFVGDSVVDEECARNTGLFFVGISLRHLEHKWSCSYEDLGSFLVDIRSLFPQTAS